MMTRYYFDANTWDRVFDHPERDELMKFLDRPGKRAVFAS